MRGWRRTARNSSSSFRTARPAAVPAYHARVMILKPARRVHPALIAVSLHPLDPRPPGRGLSRSILWAYTGPEGPPCAGPGPISGDRHRRQPRRDQQVRQGHDRLPIALHPCCTEPDPAGRATCRRMGRVCLLPPQLQPAPGGRTRHVGSGRLPALDAQQTTSRHRAAVQPHQAAVSVPRRECQAGWRCQDLQALQPP